MKSYKSYPQVKTISDTWVYGSLSWNNNTFKASDCCISNISYKSQPADLFGLILDEPSLGTVVGMVAKNDVPEIPWIPEKPMISSWFSHQKPLGQEHLVSFLQGSWPMTSWDIRKMAKPIWTWTNQWLREYCMYMSIVYVYYIEYIYIRIHVYIYIHILLCACFGGCGLCHWSKIWSQITQKVPVEIKFQVFRNC